MPEQVKRLAEADKFIWKCPVRNAQPCTPQSCIHTKDTPPGCVLVVRPDSHHETICINKECGQAAQTALADWQKAQIESEKKNYQLALNKLRCKTVEQTEIFGTQNEYITLSSELLQEKLNTLLVPNWDAKTMIHIIAGWQEAQKAMLAIHLGSEDPDSPEVLRAFEQEHGNLAYLPSAEKTLGVFKQLNNRVIVSKEHRERWLACEISVRSWRDMGDNLETVMQLLCELDVPI